MNCQLSRNMRVFDILKRLGMGHEIARYDSFLSLLGERCVLESRWLPTLLRGREEVTEYFKQKEASLSARDCFPWCDIVELTESRPPVTADKEGWVDHASVGLIYAPGKLCLLMGDDEGQKDEQVLVVLVVDEGGAVSRITLCDPKQFSFRYFNDPFKISCSKNGGLHDMQTVLINGTCKNELELSLMCVEADYYEYEAVTISMEQWHKALALWKLLVNAKNFDEIFETFAVVDYESGTIERPEIGKLLGKAGLQIWSDRQGNLISLHCLSEWTDCIKDIYDEITILNWGD